jgi:hypothetical protein
MSNGPQTEVILRHGGKELTNIKLPPGEYVIGRNPDADIYADTPLISRRHALLTINDDRLLLKDLGSVNGTFVADRPATEDIRLAPNQIIRLGDVTLEVRPAPTPVAPVPAAPEKDPAPTAPTPPPPPVPAPALTAKEPPVETSTTPKDPARSVEPSGLGRDLALFVRRQKVASIGALVVVLAGAVLGTKAFVEERRVKQTLTDLRGAAPTFEIQSRALANEGKFPDALEKIGYAARLAPDNADDHLFRANLLESAQQFSAAAAAYRRVLELRPGDAAAKTNLELCERLIAEKGDAPSLPPGAQRLLLDALHAQHRDLEAAALGGPKGQGEESAEAALRARLKTYAAQKNWKNGNIRASGKGFLVDLSSLQIGDLSELHGLPVVALLLNSTSVADLRPLAGLPLEELAIKDTPVTDLTPLHGLKLRDLDLSGTGVSDLSPLAGMPLEKLDLARTKVRDLGPLRGMPLTRLRLNGSSVANVGPLAELPTLEEVELPAGAANIERLRSLKKLRYLSARYDDAAQRPAQTAAEFWKEIDAKKAPAPKAPPAPPVKVAAKPAAKVPATPPPEPPASPEDIAADAKALGEAKQRRQDLFAKFQFTEARSAILDPALKTSQARDEQQLLAKKAQWLANFKASLIEELNKKGYGQAMSRKSGQGLTGSVMQADEQQITLRSIAGPVVVPWSDLSFDSIFTMGASFIQPDMQPDWIAYRKWHLGVFAFYAGKKKEALDLLHAAAQLKPLYKGELPIFEKPTVPW